jgi:hypothetical protein
MVLRSFLDFDGTSSDFRNRPLEVNMQQSAVDGGVLDFDTFRQNESALKLPCRDTTVQENAVLIVIILLAANNQLIVFHGDLQIVHREAGHGQGDSKAMIADLLNIVGRIALGGGFRDTVENPFEMVETK